MSGDWPVLSEKFKRICSRLGLVLLWCYVFILLSSAIPLQNAIVSFSLHFLAKFSIEPGLQLFYRPFAEDWKISASCFEAKVSNSERRFQTFFRTETLCNPPGLRITYPAFEIAIFRMFQDASISGSERMTKGKMGEFHLRRSRALMSALGDFFCHSSLASSDLRKDQITLFAWKQNRINYANGSTLTRYPLMVRARCSDGELLNVLQGAEVKENHRLSFEKGLPWPE